MAILPLALVIGLGREPSLGLAGDLRRLNWRVQLAPWPAFKSGWRGAKPGVVVIDFRALNAEAAAACRAVRAGSALRRVPLLAVVPEQEAAGVDLSLGLDDLLLSPYRLTDLEARLRVLRWRQERERTAGVLRAGRLTLDPATYQAAIDGVPLDLTLKEYQLLLFLVRHPNRVHTRTELLDRVWGGDYYGGTRTVDVHIRRLRAKTEAAGDLIETVRGVGYRLVAR